MAARHLVVHRETDVASVVATHDIAALINLVDLPCGVVAVADEQAHQFAAAVRIGRAGLSDGANDGVSAATAWHVRHARVIRCRRSRCARGAVSVEIIVYLRFCCGASGSPILNDKGQLVGINNAGFEKQGLNMGVKAKYIVELLK